MQLAVVQLGVGIHSVETVYGFAPPVALDSVGYAPHTLQQVRDTCEGSRQLLTPEEAKRVAGNVQAVEGLVQRKVELLRRSVMLE